MTNHRVFAVVRSILDDGTEIGLKKPTFTICMGLGDHFNFYIPVKWDTFSVLLPKWMTFCKVFRCFTKRLVRSALNYSC